MEQFPSYGWGGVLALVIAFVIAIPAGGGLNFLTGVLTLAGLALVITAWVTTSERNRKG